MRCKCQVNQTITLCQRDKDKWRCKQNGVSYRSPGLLRSPGAHGRSALSSHPGTREPKPSLIQQARALLPRAWDRRWREQSVKEPLMPPLHHKAAKSGSDTIKTTLLPTNKGRFPHIFWENIGLWFSSADAKHLSQAASDSIWSHSGRVCAGVKGRMWTSRPPAEKGDLSSLKASTGASHRQRAHYFLVWGNQLCVPPGCLLVAGPSEKNILSAGQAPATSLSFQNYSKSTHKICHLTFLTVQFSSIKYILIVEESSGDWLHLIKLNSIPIEELPMAPSLPSPATTLDFLSL